MSAVVHKQKFFEASILQAIFYLASIAIANSINLGLPNHGFIKASVIFIISTAVFISFVAYSFFSMRRYKAVGIPRFLAIPMVFAPLYLVKYFAFFGIAMGGLLLCMHLCFGLLLKERE